METQGKLQADAHFYIACNNITSQTVAGSVPSNQIQVLFYLA